MSTCINKRRRLRRQTLYQWLWFGALWCLGLSGALLISLPIKLLVKACQ